MKRSIKSIFLLMLMLISAAIALAIKPEPMQLNASQRMDYEYIIPKEFGSWRMLPANSISIVNPQTAANLERLYSQVVTRTYVEALTGKVVMLSVAYGEEQNKQSQVHLPEVCYPAQGFQIISNKNDLLQTSVGAIPVKRVLAKSGTRVEPITYWVRLGNSIVLSRFEQKIMTIKQGLTGQESDGLLFRISTIESDSDNAYQLQDKFVKELLNATKSEFRRLLVGNTNATK
jgi:EpsI family protein